MATISRIDSGNVVNPFPKLMQHTDGTIVLFLAERIGTVVFTTTSDDIIGSYAEDWVMSGFSDYNGTVTLSNE